MEGSKLSAMLFLTGALLWVAQSMVSLLIFDDQTGGLIAWIVIIPMFFGVLFAWRGGLSVVLQKVGTDRYQRIDTYQDSGQRIAMAPWWGCCWGMAGIVIAFVAGEELLSFDGIVYLLPGLIGGLLGILASIVYIKQVKGPFMGTD